MNAEYERGHNDGANWAMDLMDGCRTAEEVFAEGDAKIDRVLADEPAGEYRDGQVAGIRLWIDYVFK